MKMKKWKFALVGLGILCCIAAWFCYLMIKQPLLKDLWPALWGIWFMSFDGILIATGAMNSFDKRLHIIHGGQSEESNSNNNIDIDNSSGRIGDLSSDSSLPEGN